MSNKIWINLNVRRLIEREANKEWPLETGGVLAGYVADNGDMVIRTASGPGPNALHGRFNFKPDHDFHLTFLYEAYLKSGGVSYYLGDWHSHPGSSPMMSIKDRRTLMRIAAHEEVSTPDPLMLIVGNGHNNAWHYLAHRFIGPSWMGLGPVAAPQPITYF